MIIFVHLPKTGGSLIGLYLLSLDVANHEIITGNDGQIRNPHFCISQCRFDSETVYKFGFIRNPFDWYVSRYHYFAGKPMSEQGISKLNDCGMCNKNLEIKSWSEILKKDVYKLVGPEKDELKHFLSRPRTVTFKEYFPTLKHHIMYGLNNPSLPRFWLSDMYKAMFYKDDKLHLNFVGRFENISEDIEYVLINNKINYTQTLNDFNKNDNFKHQNMSYHNHYSEYYDNELKDIIYEKDKLIFEEYNYDF